MELRLFPLQTVLFPGMPLPLQVFEARYRQLVAECLDASEPFGVALIQEGAEVGGPAVPHALGTTARIQSVEPDERGRLQLETLGERRFRIVGLHVDRPYLWADVEYPVDEVSEVPEALVQRARERYAALVRLRLMATGEYVRDVRMPDVPGALADAAGAIAIAPPQQLQELLEIMDVRRRLERAVELLEVGILAAHQLAAAAMSRRYGDLESLN